jgi:hypothetical protein
LLLTLSVVGGWLMLPDWWRFIPAAVSVIVLSWLWTRPSV